MGKPNGKELNCCGGLEPLFNLILTYEQKWLYISSQVRYMLQHLTLERQGQ
jgi:hypothetical protein